MSLNRLKTAISRPVVPITTGTTLALKSHRSDTASAVPISPIMNIVNSCDGRNVGAWKLRAILPNPPWARMSCHSGRTRPMIAMVSRTATIGRSSQVSP